MKNKLIVSAVTLGAAGMLLYGAASTVSAQSPSDTAHPMQSLVQKIAERFGLSETDVQAVFDEQRDEMHAAMQTRIEDRLTQLVTDGKITEAQKQALIAKMDELKSEHEADRENWKDMTPEERKAAMDTHREELKSWAEAQGIDLSVLGGLMRPFGHMRGGWAMH